MLTKIREHYCISLLLLVIIGLNESFGIFNKSYSRYELCKQVGLVNHY